MSTKHLIDPQLEPLLEQTSVLNETTLDAARQSMDELAAISLEQQKQNAAIKFENRYISSDGRNLRLLIIKPAGAVEALPAIYHVHGGGMVVGSPEIWLTCLCRLVEDLQCVVVSVDYRLAPETPFPGPLHDCYEGLAWLFEQAAELQVDASRIAIMGESAGGGLAAALALYTRDQGKYSPVFQQLSCPMLDDRTPTRQNPYPNTVEFVWPPESDYFGWRALLGREPGSEDISYYASPARAQDLAGLPPAMLYIGELDLFLNETLDYASRLMQAGVSTELHIYPGAFHGFEMLPETRLAQSAYRDIAAALGRAFA